MTTSMQFTDADRDANGFIRLSPPTENAAPELPPSPARSVPAPTLRVSVPQRLIVLASGGMIGLALIVLTIAFGARPGRIVPRMTAVPSAAGTAASPSPIPHPPSPVAILPAYGAPNEAPRWQIEATRAITPVAHFGDDWIQADVAGSGVIWLRASDWPALALIGPDLAPRPTPVSMARPVAPAEIDPPSPPDVSADESPTAAVRPTATPVPTWDAPAFQRVLDATATTIYTTAHAIETATGHQAVVVPATPTAQP